MENTKTKITDYWKAEDTGRLLSEQESSNLVGVSLETIKRYQEFGLLKPVMKNNLPFYREKELKNLFLITSASDKSASEKPVSVAEASTGAAAPKNQSSVPTLSDLLSERLAPVGESLKTDSSEQNAIEPEDTKSVSAEPPSQQLSAPVPAIRMEDLVYENKGLKDRLKSLEDERDWLRQRVEQLEERSGREQMLLLSEKETLRDVLNATVVRPSLPSAFSDVHAADSLRLEQKKPEAQGFRLISKIKAIFS
jgi:DNA-binding transcriptional MerR regulator